MLRKLGLIVAAGALAVGCGAAPVPSPAGDPPAVVSSSPAAESSPASSVPASTPVTSAPPATTAVAPDPAPATEAKPLVEAKTPAAPKTQPAPRTQPKAAAPKVTPPPAAPAGCGDDYYRNSSGNCVHNPSSNPSGASAVCKDGSFSYSQHRSGTCSGHGGVRTWL